MGNNYENNNSLKAAGILGSKTKEILQTANTNTSNYKKKKSPNTKEVIHSCLRLLSTEDVDRNRVGLQRLAIAVTKEGQQQRDTPISRALVYGGPSGSDEELLQFVFTALICDAPHDDTCDMDYHNQDEDPTTPDDCRDDKEEEEQKKEALFDWILEYDPSADSSTEGNSRSDSGDIEAGDDGRDEESDSDHFRSSPLLGGSKRDNDESIEDIITALAEFEHRRAQRLVDDTTAPSHDNNNTESCTDTPKLPRSESKTNRILRNQALRILSNSLNKFAAQQSSSPQRNEKDDDIPFLHEVVWRNIVASIIDNIENDSDGHSRSSTAAGTGYSLSILRSLHVLRPDLVAPLMRYTMFERISHYANEHRVVHPFPMIRTEASHL